MDLDATISTIIGAVRPGLDQAIDTVASYIPDELSQVIWHASSYLPKEISWVNAAEFMLYFAAASLILGILSRVMLGKRSSLNHSLSSVMGILFIYAVTITIYTFKPWNLEVLLSPLPFVTFSGEHMIVLPLTDVQFPTLCTQILSLVILAFLVNLLDTFLPKGEYLISWLLLRLMTIAMSMGTHLIVRWGFETFLPEVLVQYAPMILLILLLIMLFSGALSLVLGMAIAVANPFLGAMYTFFFSNIVGKQVSKAVFTSAIIVGIIFLLDHFGYTIIPITAAALLTYIPLALVLVVLWYLIGHVL